MTTSLYSEDFILPNDTMYVQYDCMYIHAYTFVCRDNMEPIAQSGAYTALKYTVICSGSDMYTSAPGANNIGVL